MTATNLKVQEVSGGNTAADLGLAGIDVAASTATGSDLVRMHEQLKLDRLNDSTGVNIRDELPDLLVTFRDGSQSLQMDLERDGVTTVGDLLDALNAADPTRLRAELSADGDRLVLTDLTAGSGTFSISSAIGGTVAEDLGLTAPALGGTITGQRLLSGLKGALLGSLSGGRGLGTLGIVSLTDRGGATATVNLSSAETLADVVAQLNSSGLAISAQINTARNGIELSDSSGATASNLIVADADATNTATKLHIAVNDAVQRVDSGSLALQVVHENTTLASLNQGRGVRQSSFFITDTNGMRGGVSLLTSGAETVGDVIDLINGLDIAVEARINDTGDGILLVDTAGGSQKITVTESGTGTTAADLNLLGESTLVDIGGTPTHVIDGSSTETLTLDADDTLQDLVAMINDRNLGIAASVLRSGSGDTPYRISLVSEETGTTGEMLVDASQLNLSFREVIGAQDALLQMGSTDAPGSGILITSSNNRFDSVVDGLALTMQGASDTPVSVEVKTTDKDLVAAVDLFVNQYNSLWDKIKSLTFFDEKTQTTGILFGSVETLRIESAVSRVVTSPYYGLGSIRSLEELGVSVKEDGKLAFDKTKFAAKYEADPASVEQFFTDETRGFSQRMSAAIEILAGEDDSLLVSRNLAMESKIQANNERLDWLNQRLDTERERLLGKFYAMELAIAKIQSNMSAIQSISALPPLTGGSN
jgi:flagellar hook-associated protein 2